MTDSFNVEQSQPVAGLGTFACTVQADGLYEIDVISNIPYTPATSSGTQNIVDITAVADSMGSLNSTYFTFSTSGDIENYYVWYNINSAGVDPAVAGKTGIEVAAATDATANAIASATRTAITNAVDLVTVSGGTSHIIITDNNIGLVTAAANGTADPGFSFSVTQAGSYSGASGLVITVYNDDGSVAIQSAYPTPSQPTLGASTRIEASAGDEISVVFSSLAEADQFANAVKSNINFYQLIKE